MIMLNDLMTPVGDTSETESESIALTAIVDSALCVGAGGSAGSLADKPIVRTASGQLLIPASQFKGRLRHECEKLLRGLGLPVCHSPNPQNMCPERADAGEQAEAFTARSDYDLGLGDRLLPMPTNDDDRSPPASPPAQYHCYICQIFGNPALPARVLFDDLICETLADELPEVLRPGVTINRRRRTAEDQKLYFLETSPAQMPLEFKGYIHLLPNAPAFTQTLLKLALGHIHALGGSKSAGLGWLHWQDEFKTDIKTLRNLLNC